MPECFTKSIPADGLKLTHSTSGAWLPYHVKIQRTGRENETGESEIIEQSIKKTYGYFLLRFESYRITKKERYI